MVVSKRGVEINLLIFAEAEMKSGLALAHRLANQNGLGVAVTIVAESPATLLERVKSELGSSGSDGRGGYRVESKKPDADVVIPYLESQRALRIVLLPGLDQLDTLRRDLLRELQATVVCFEPHSGLEQTPQGLWLLGADEGGNAGWLAERIASDVELKLLDPSVLSDMHAGKSRQLHTSADWVLVSADAANLESRTKSCRLAIEAAVGPVLLILGQASWRQWLMERKLPGMAVRFIPQMERDTRRALAEHLQQYSQLDFEFISLICASTFLASFGLLQNSAAVIIGAMLVAPLMTPILGAGLSLAQGNRPLFTNSLKTISIGFVAALATSLCLGLIVRFLVPSILQQQDGVIRLTDEMWARTHPTSIDFLVGLVGGSAAAFARTRTHLADALAGAAIAAALVPPIATAGLHLSLYPLEIAAPDRTGVANNLIFGPALLFVANMLTIMIGSSFVLWACGVRSNHSYSRRERWSTRVTMLLMTLTAVVLVWIVQYS